jgi:hypothetical protein
VAAGAAKEGLAEVELPARLAGGALAIMQLPVEYTLASCHSCIMLGQQLRALNVANAFGGRLLSHAAVSGIFWEAAGKLTTEVAHNDLFQQAKES